MHFRPLCHRLLIFALSIFLCKTGLSQKAMSEFGAFTAKEQGLKQCDFDKEAEAVVLLDRAESNYDDNYNLMTQRRNRVKILKEAGIERGQCPYPVLQRRQF
jgi:hypothetical protein